MKLSRFMPEVLEFAMKANAKAAYCFVIDGDKGTGGCPVVVGLPPHDEYLRRCRELIQMLLRSATLLARDIGQQSQSDQSPPTSAQILALQTKFAELEPGEWLDANDIAVVSWALGVAHQDALQREAREATP